MKKTSLVALMVLMITTPCFAQEVETEGLFGVEGTYWAGTFTADGITNPFLDLGFYGGSMYESYLGNVYPADPRSSYSVSLLQRVSRNPRRDRNPQTVPCWLRSNHNHFSSVPWFHKAYPSQAAPRSKRSRSRRACCQGY